MDRVIIVWTVFNRSTSEKCHLMTIGLEKAGVKTYSVGFSDTLEQRDYLKDAFKIDHPYDYEHGVKRTLYQGGNYLTKILNNIYMSSSLTIRLFACVLKKRVSAIIIPTQPIEVTLPSIVIGKLFGVKVVANVMEYYPALPAYNIRKNILIRMSWGLIIKLSDAFIVISDFIYEKLKYITDKEKMIFPAILPEFDEDFSMVEIRKKNSIPLFVYTSSPGYEDLLEFVLNSLAKINHKKFRLIITGKYSDCARSKWNEKIRQLELVEKVDFSGFLTEKELMTIQKKSDALLIPLIDNDRHKARFPQKTLGYMRLGKPIVTTSVGEHGRYFKDGDTALMDSSVTTKGFSDKINEVIDFPMLSTEIGLRGKRYVEEYFNVEKWGKELRKFLKD